MDKIEFQKDLDFIKNSPSRLRDAEYEGEKIKVRIFNRSARTRFLDILSIGNEEFNAELLSYIILNKDEREKYTAEYFLSDDCFDCEPIELLKIWRELQMFGSYKKK